MNGKSPDGKYASVRDGKYGKTALINSTFARCRQVEKMDLRIPTFARQKENLDRACRIKRFAFAEAK